MSRVMIERGAFVKTIPAYLISDYEADGWVRVQKKAQEHTEPEPDKGKKKSGK